MNYKIAVIGDKDSTLPLKVLGIDVFISKNCTDSKAIVKNLVKEQYGIIYITEQLAVDIPEVLAHYRQQTVPIIIPIPNYKGTLGIGMTDINSNVEKAIGRSIL